MVQEAGDRERLARVFEDGFPFPTQEGGDQEATTGDQQAHERHGDIYITMSQIKKHQTQKNK
jgi:hypothetical protein